MVSVPGDAGRYFVRPFRESDYEAYAFLRRQYRPARALTAEELRHLSEAHRAPGGIRCWFLAVEKASGRAVGWAALDQRTPSVHPRKLWANVLVGPEHLGRGLGRMLFAMLEEEARRRDTLALWTEVRTDLDRGVDFFHRQGFVELRRRHLSWLDVDAPDLGRLGDRSAALRSDGIEVTTLAREGPDRDDVRRKYYDLVRLAEKDVPDLGERTPRAFEQFVRADLEGPAFYPEGTFLARTQSEFVGVTALERVAQDPVRLHIGFTGTSPRWRRRGIATTLKCRAIEFARSLGYRWMDATNDAENRAIAAINERLGFRTVETRILGEKRLRSGE